MVKRVQKKIRKLGIFDSAGRVFMKIGSNGKAFVNTLNPFTGKMQKNYGRKAVYRHQGMVKKAHKGIPAANRPMAGHLRMMRNK